MLTNCSLTDNICAIQYVIDKALDPYILSGNLSGDDLELDLTQLYNNTIKNLLKRLEKSHIQNLVLHYPVSMCNAYEYSRPLSAAVASTLTSSIYLLFSALDPSDFSIGNLMLSMISGGIIGSVTSDPLKSETIDFDVLMDDFVNIITSISSLKKLKLVCHIPEKLTRGTAYLTQVKNIESLIKKQIKHEGLEVSSAFIKKNKKLF